MASEEGQAHCEPGEPFKFRHRFFYLDKAAIQPASGPDGQRQVFVDGCELCVEVDDSDRIDSLESIVSNENH